MNTLALLAAAITFVMVFTWVMEVGRGWRALAYKRERRMLRRENDELREWSRE